MIVLGRGIRVWGLGKEGLGTGKLAYEAVFCSGAGDVIATNATLLWKKICISHEQIS